MKQALDIIGNLLVVAVFAGLAWGFYELDWPIGFRLAAMAAAGFVGLLVIAVFGTGGRKGSQ